MVKSKPNMQAHQPSQDQDTLATPRYTLGKRVVVPTINISKVRIESSEGALTVEEIKNLISEDKTKKAR